MNPSPYKALWASALLLAIRDTRKHLRKHRTTTIPDGMNIPGDEGDAIRWITSDSPRPGGFIWVCSMLEHDPTWVRDRIRMPRMADKKTLDRLDDFLEGE
jgi:hypothetical protein